MNEKICINIYLEVSSCGKIISFSFYKKSFASRSVYFFCPTEDITEAIQVIKIYNKKMFISTRKESFKNFTFARHTESKRNPEKQKATYLIYVYKWMVEQGMEDCK